MLKLNAVGREAKWRGLMSPFVRSAANRMCDLDVRNVGNAFVRIVLIKMNKEESFAAPVPFSLIFKTRRPRLGRKQ